MRLIIQLVVIGLTGCAPLFNGQAQPVIIKDAKEGIFFTTCSGMAETWGQCNEKALKTCSRGYTSLKKNESISSASRELTFKCN